VGGDEIFPIYPSTFYVSNSAVTRGSEGYGGEQVGLAQSQKRAAHKWEHFQQTKRVIVQVIITSFIQVVYDGFNELKQK